MGFQLRGSFFDLLFERRIHVAKQFHLVLDRLGPGRELEQLHVGGGTPNYLSDSQLVRLMEMVAAGFFGPRVGAAGAGGKDVLPLPLAVRVRVFALERVGKVLAVVSRAVVAVIVFLGVVRGQDFLEMLLFGIALAVAVVPEALPAVVTISLAMGVRSS